MYLIFTGLQRGMLIHEPTSGMIQANTGKVAGTMNSISEKRTRTYKKSTDLI